MLGLRFVIWTKDNRNRSQTGDWIGYGRAQIGWGFRGFMLPVNLYGPIASIAARYPRMRVLIDHLGVSPALKIPEAVGHLDELLSSRCTPQHRGQSNRRAQHATDSYLSPARTLLCIVYSRPSGAQSILGNQDITRLAPSWRECITLFSQELPWLKGDDLELVMGRAVCDWVGCRDSPGEQRAGPCQNQSGQRVADSGGDRRPVGLLLDAEIMRWGSSKAGPGFMFLLCWAFSEFESQLPACAAPSSACCRVRDLADAAAVLEPGSAPILC